MFYRKLNAYTVGLVFRNGAYERMITKGVSRIGFAEKVYGYDVTLPFVPPCDLNILLADAKLAEMLEVLIVKDNEIALRFENEIFKDVLVAGRYAFWKGPVKRTFLKVDMNEVFVPKQIDVALMNRKEMLNYIRIAIVETYEKGLLFVNGKFEKIMEPGNYFFLKNNIPSVILKVDTRLLQLEIPGQEILTKDKANLRLNLVAQYKIVDVEKAVLENKDFDKQLYVTLQLAFREYISNLAFDELLEKKDAVAEFVSRSVAEKAKALGIELVNCGIRDIILPGELKEIMNQVLIAEKKAQANTIMRREETASTRSLLNTAKLMEENQMLFKLKEMEYVERIAEKINNISLSGGTLLVDQLKQIFVPDKK